MLRNPNFDVDGLEFAVMRPGDVPSDSWPDIQNLARVAFGMASVPRRTDEELDYFTLAKHPDAFEASRLDPMLAGLRGEYREPLVGLVRDGNTLVGYGYTYLNVSGSQLARRIKWAVPYGLPMPKFGGRVYAATRELTVHPAVQGHGIAHVLDYLLHERRHSKQTSTRYIYEEMPRAMGYSESLGFQKPTDEKTGMVVEPEKVHPFGPERAAYMHRLSAKVGAVMSNIIQLPDAKEAVVYARRTAA